MKAHLLLALLLVPSLLMPLAAAGEPRCQTLPRNPPVITRCMGSEVETERCASWTLHVGQDTWLGYCVNPVVGKAYLILYTPWDTCDSRQLQNCDLAFP